MIEITQAMRDHAVRPEDDPVAWLWTHAHAYAMPAGPDDAERYATWYVERYGQPPDCVEHAPAHSGEYGWPRFLRECADAAMREEVTR